MLILATIVSIFAISAAAWFANRLLPVAVCPSCAGVFLTWVWLVGAHFLGYEIALIVPALLMGGSVIGIMYQLERRSPARSAAALFLWKVLFASGGFTAAYALLAAQWTLFLFATAAALLVSLAPFLRGRNERDAAARAIEKKLEECC